MAIRENYTADELEDLTDDERAGLLDETLADDPRSVEDSMEEGAGDSDEEAALDAKAVADAKAAADKADADAAAAATKAAADKAAKELAEKDPEAAAKAAADAKAAEDKRVADEAAAKATADAAAAAAAPKPAPAANPARWTPPADAAEKLAALETKLAELDAKFDDGEITAAEHRAQTKPLLKDSASIENQVQRAQNNRQDAIDTWSQDTVPAFLTANNYKVGSPLYVALDAEVRKLQVDNPNPYDAELLTKAHTAVINEARAAVGLPPLDPAAKPAPKKDPADTRILPPTLGGLPADAVEPVGDVNRFAYLDRLKGQAHEDALEKLSEADLEAYLAQGE